MCSVPNVFQFSGPFKSAVIYEMGLMRARCVDGLDAQSMKRLVQTRRRVSRAAKLEISRLFVERARTARNSVRDWSRVDFRRWLMFGLGLVRTFITVDKPKSGEHCILVMAAVNGADHFMQERISK